MVKQIVERRTLNTLINEKDKMADLKTLYYRHATTMIMLPCHAIYKGHGSGRGLSDWHMESFQKEGNDHLSWIKQIQRCVGLVRGAARKDSIVVISGGKTKKIAGNVSESLSYLNLLLQNKEMFMLLPHSGCCEDEQDEILGSIYLEEYAKDSFENLLYSICRFKEITNRYPEKVVIVGYEFKRSRFVNLHAKAIDSQYYGEIEYLGIDPVPPYASDSEGYARFFQDLEKNEYNNAISLFEKDPHGLEPPLLDKKKKRNPFNTIAPYAVTSETLLKSVNYC